MIDLIFFTFFSGLFVIGFYCGSKYGNAKSMFNDIGKKISSFLD